MSDVAFTMINASASLVMITCGVLSFRVTRGISRELRGLKTMDVMWQYLIVMVELFIIFGITRAVGSVGNIIFPGSQQVFDALLAVVLILYFVFAILFSMSLEEITE